MNTEAHHKAYDGGGTPRHTDVSFEKRDVHVGTIYRYLIALGVATFLALVICIFVLRFTTNFAASVDTPPPASREASGNQGLVMPPEPRLQGVPGHESDPQQDLRNKIKADTEANEKLHWINKNSAIAEIPVKDAMKIIAEKGLAVQSAVPATKK